MWRLFRSGGVLRRLLLLAAALLAAAALAGLGVWIQTSESQGRDTEHVVGADEADRLDVYASIQRVDAAAGEMVLRIHIKPRGRIASDEYEDSPAGDLVLFTSSSLKGDLKYPAKRRTSSVDLPVELADGAITDYPIDSYLAEIGFGAVQGDSVVPVKLTLGDAETFFHPVIKTRDTTNKTASFEVGLSRSRSVMIFATFMIATMWGLAFAVLIGAWQLISRRRGLVWPALGWMAAALFAIVGFRNAAPGSPPIGSLLDYIAFLWVETIIALSVIVAVIAGARAEPPVARAPSAP